MIKLMGAVMVGASCGYFGFRMSMSLKRRMENLSDIAVSLELLESEISFGQSRLTRAFERVDRNGLFKSAASRIEELGINKAWRAAVEENRTKMCLTDSDADTLLMLGKNLGKTDTDDQLKHIKYIKTIIEGLSREAREEYKRLGKMYRSGGVLAGLMLIIILI